ncbi:MAG: VirD4-like conjugal transfer protein, CD1115 family [Clostridium sp.]
MEKIIQKFKKTAPIALALFVILSIFVLPSISLTILSLKSKIPLVENSTNSINDLYFFVTHPFSSIGMLFTKTAALPYYYLLFKLLIVVVLFIWVILTVKTKTKDSDYTDIEQGSSRWCKEGEQYQILNKDNGILLAKDNYLPVDKLGNINITVIGGSGSGKSATFGIPNVLGLLGSYVFTDPKGELYNKTSAYFKENGYKIKVLNLVNTEASDGYNPLLHIKSQPDVDIIVNTIMKGQGDENKSSGGDGDFWDNLAENLFKSVIYFLLSTRPKEEINLATCANLVRAAAANTGRTNMFEELLELLPHDHLARKYFANVKLSNDKVFASIATTLQSKLSKFDAPNIAALTATDTIDFKSIGEEKTALFVISPDSQSTYDFILTMFFSQLLQELYAEADKQPDQKLKMPVYFFLDEFANIGQIPEFDKKISTSRSRRISFSIILQNLDQLEALYPKSYETILANCDTHLFLGSNSKKTSEYFSQALGKITLKVENKSTSKNTKNKDSENETTSTNIMSRDLMTPDEIKNLDNNKCIILEKGVPPILADKFWYFKEEKAKPLLEYAFKSVYQDYKVDRGTWNIFDPTRKVKVNSGMGINAVNPNKIHELENNLLETQKEVLKSNKVTKEKKIKNKDITQLSLDELFKEETIKMKNDKVKQIEELNLSEENAKDIKTEKNSKKLENKVSNLSLDDIVFENKDKQDLLIDKINNKYAIELEKELDKNVKMQKDQNKKIAEINQKILDEQLENTLVFDIDTEKDKEKEDIKKKKKNKKTKEENKLKDIEYEDTNLSDELAKMFDDLFNK